MGNPAPRKQDLRNLGLSLIQAIRTQIVLGLINGK